MNIIPIIVPLVPIIWTYLLYPIFLRRVSKKPWRKDDDYEPSVSFIVPVYNREGFIEAKVENILGQDFPRSKMEIIFVESGSTDETRQRITECMREFPSTVKGFWEKERRGKNSATNLGLAHVHHEIILLTDVDSSFQSRSALRKILRNFADPLVGGVAPAYFGKFEGNSKIVKCEESYWLVENRLWKMESLYDSVSAMLGECLAFRRGLVKEIPLSSMADDLHCAIQIRKMGYRVVYEPEVVIHEPIPRSFKAWFKQKKRRTVHNFMTLRNNLDIFFRYHPYGTIILPTHKLLTSLTPIFLLILGLSLLCSLGNFLGLFLGATVIGILIAFFRYKRILFQLGYIIALLSVVSVALLTFPFVKGSPLWEPCK